MRSLVASWIFLSRISHVSLLTWSTSFLLNYSICCQKCCRCVVPSSFGNLWICNSCWVEMIMKSRVIKFSGLSGNVQTKSLDQHSKCLQNVYVFAYVINKIRYTLLGPVSVQPVHCAHQAQLARSCCNWACAFLGAIHKAWMSPQLMCIQICRGWNKIVLYRPYQIPSSEGSTAKTDPAHLPALILFLFMWHHETCCLYYLLFLLQWCSFHIGSCILNPNNIK